MALYSVFTSESVSEGHPDKMADQISDAVLDAIIKEDRNARVAVETLVKTGMAIIAGTIRHFDIVAVQEIKDSTGEAIVTLSAAVNSAGRPTNT